MLINLQYDPYDPYDFKTGHIQLSNLYVDLKVSYLMTNQLIV